MAFLSREDVVEAAGHDQVELVEDPAAFGVLDRIQNQLEFFQMIGYNPRGVDTNDFDWAAYRSVYGPQIQVAPVGNLLIARHKRTGNVQTGIKADAQRHWATAATLVGLAE